MSNINKGVCPFNGLVCEDGVRADFPKDSSSSLGSRLKCRFWIKVQGKNPQDGTDIEHWDCSHSWVPILLIENSNMIRQNSARSDKIRTELTCLNKNIKDSLSPRESFYSQVELDSNKINYEKTKKTH